MTFSALPERKKPAYLELHCPLFQLHCPLFQLHCPLFQLHCPLFQLHCLLSFKFISQNSNSISCETDLRFLSLPVSLSLLLSLSVSFGVSLSPYRSLSASDSGCEVD
jgi:hypothetical protein